MVSIVFFLTRNEPKKFRSNATVYTGIASGTSIVSLDNTRTDMFGTRTAFDNLINIIKTRSTAEEVGLQLLATHLMMEFPKDEVIQKEHFKELQEMIPKEVKEMVVKGDFNRTLKNLKEYKNRNYTNFIYKLINYSNRYYSSSQILAQTRVYRVQTSDMIEIHFESDDPGICQNTLKIIIDVFIREYSNIKANQSDAVVKYFNGQLDIANERLNYAENELLQFNRANNIINYYEQTKHIASEKEQFQMLYQGILMQNAAAKSVIGVLESKMSSNEKAIANNSLIENLRNNLAQVNLEIAMQSNQEPTNSENEENKIITNLSSLQERSYQLQEALKEAVLQNYNIGNTPEGISGETVLENWLKNVIEYESTKAQLIVGKQKEGDFRKIFEEYAPLGATMKRLERKIDVAEREYLSLLQSLNTAKLKQQNIELNSDLKIVAPPIYPIVSEPSKRKFLLLIAFLIGLILPTFAIIVLEFLDQNIKNVFRAELSTGIKVAAIFPILETDQNVDYEFIKDRALDILSRRLILNAENDIDLQKPNINLIFSVLNGEGKTLITELLIPKLNEYGYKALFLTPDNKDNTSASIVSTLQYHPDKEFHKANTIKDLNANWDNFDVSTFDYVFVELPGILYNTYPIKLFKNAHHSFLVTRANRAWTKADKHAIKEILEYTKDNHPQMILNGVAIEEMESVLGDLPKKRSFFRKVLKNILRLQFFSQKEIDTHNREDQKLKPHHGLYLKIGGAFLIFLVILITGYLIYLRNIEKRGIDKKSELKSDKSQMKDNIDSLNYLINLIPSSIENEPDAASIKTKGAINYQVVAGIFRSKENANLCFGLYKQFGYVPLILEESGGLFRVIIGSYQSKEEAEKTRNEVMDFVPNANASIYTTTQTEE
jgi:polysaccharide biosynthesis transport protein